MTFFQAILLGIVQGLTEFFPISSSAHLKLARSLLGAPDDLFFDLICHSGTLLALLIFLKTEVFEVLKSVKKMALFILALTPLIPGYFFLKPVRLFLSEPHFLGYALMMTGALLFFASKKKEVNPNKKWQHVVCIGVMQTMALIPGISRSGSTIAAARFCGWDWREAAKFSFLLAIPTILGGEALELMRNSSGFSAHSSCYLAGFLASFSLGLISVRFIFWIYDKGKVRPFAWYCLAVGLLAWALYHG